MSKIRHF